MTDAKEILTQANADYTSGRYKQAADGFRQVLDMHPDIGELYINYGVACRACGNIVEAEEAYKNAIRLLPDSAFAWFNLGNLLSDLRRIDEAIPALQKADTLQPGTPEILNNLGVQLYARGSIEEALWHYEAALANNPDFADALTNCGNALQRLSRMDEARQALEGALKLDPDNPVFHLNMSAFSAAVGKYEDALHWAKRAIALNPDYIEAQLKRASLLIQQGRLVEGFEAYEARWQIPNWHPLASTLFMPAWQGETIHGKHLLVWNEQGFGDALLYARYLPVLAASGIRVTFMCEAPLMRLMRDSFGGSVTIADLSKPPPHADVQASIMSLPYLMKTELETIPASCPYLNTAKEDVAHWREKLTQNSSGKPTVGLVWAGNPKQAHDYTRSIDPTLLAPIAAREDITLVNLLVGPRGDQWPGPAMVDLRADIEDFADSAALMSALDMVISVDSAPAHLAGSLNVPVCILLSFDPDSRYFLNSDTSPWYPSAKLFRQTRPGDWEAPVSAINTALNALI